MGMLTLEHLLIVTVDA